ncbi:unnamed protein product [Darwinula stevensoni]|uniref:Uncharacterized protein n=1 Tax=Darwinula stevensoni TaxID=69355 RepID=A0A7R9ADC4_9CRUS|nr:unnamed protein product [Darwinula stevensoni]CAG0900649.1 unnamed protein product [Darwinula stevensoni]
MSTWCDEKPGLEASDSGFFENFTNLKENAALQRHLTVRRVQSKSHSSPPISIALVPPTYDEPQAPLEELRSDVLYAVRHTPGISGETRQGLYKLAQKVLQGSSSVVNGSWDKFEAAASERKVSSISHSTSDPYCRLYLNEKGVGNQMFETAVSKRTLEPEWNEDATLLGINCQDDNLHVVVRDHSTEDVGLKDYLKHIEDVNDATGLGRYLRSVASVCRSVVPHNGHALSAGRSQLGKLILKVKDLPAGTTTGWFPLEYKGYKAEIRLSIRLNAQWTPEGMAWPSLGLARLWNLCIQNELESCKGPSYLWPGVLSSLTSSLLRNCAAVWAMSRAQEKLATWLGHWQVQESGQSLDFVLLHRLLEEFPSSRESSELSDMEVRLHCNTSVHKDHVIRYFRYLDRLHRLLSDWKVDIGEKKTKKEAIEEALHTGNEQWYECLKASAECEASSKAEEKVRSLRMYIDIISMANAELHDERNAYHDVFLQYADIHYCDIAFLDFQEQLTEDVKPVIRDWCDQLEFGTTQHRLSSVGLEMENPYDSNDAGSEVFELYLAIQTLLREKQRSCGKSLDDSVCGLMHYYKWFSPAIYGWVEIARSKARHRIKKAVALDSWEPLDEIVLHSMSAVNTTNVFHSITAFWKQLAWPDDQSGLAFVCHVLKCICDCAVFYADEVAFAVKEGNYFCTDSDFRISNKMCWALSSVEHVRCSLSKVPRWLEPDPKDPHGKKKPAASGNVELPSEMNGSLLRNLKEIQDARSKERRITPFSVGSSTAAEEEKEIEEEILDSQKHLQELTKTEDAVKMFLEYGSDRIVETVGKLINDLVEKANQVLCEYVRSACDLPLENESKVEAKAHAVALYVDATLNRCRSNLPESVFQNFPLAIWTQLLKTSLSDLQHSVRNPLVLARTLEMVHGQCLLDEKPTEEVEALLQILRLRCQSTPRLILNYYRARWETQKEITPPGELGALTIQAYINNTTLHALLLNGRGLRSPRKNNNDPDPYVSLQVQGSWMQGQNQDKVRTVVQKQTRFPIFDHAFNIEIPDGDIDETVMVFTVRDKQLSHNMLIGEAVLPLEKLSRDVTQEERKSLPQIHLPLTLPGNPPIHGRFSQKTEA